MSGTKESMKKAVKTMKQRYGVDERGKSIAHAKAGAIGGRASGTGGVYNDSKRAGEIGSIGGRRSKRGHKLIEVKDDVLIYKRMSDGKLVTFLRRDVEKI